MGVGRPIIFWRVGIGKIKTMSTGMFNDGNASLYYFKNIVIN